MKKSVYKYIGPVYEFSKCICPNWSATTWAESEKKARNNMTYQYKKEHGRADNAKLTLPGKIEKIV